MLQPVRKLLALTLCLPLVTGAASTHAEEPTLDRMKQHVQHMNDLQQAEQRLLELKQELRDQSRALRHVGHTLDRSQKHQLQADLRPFHTALLGAHQLEKQEHVLDEKLQAARMRKELAAERELVPQKLDLQRQQLTLLEAARQEATALLSKWRRQTQ